MQKLSSSRRQFLRQSVIAAAGVSLLGCGNNAGGSETISTETNAMPAKPLPYVDEIGIQLWTVRDQMAIDPETTLRTIKELGYHQVELGDTRTLAELKPICDDLGLRVNSSFINWNTVTGGWQYAPDDTPFDFGEVLEAATKAGLSHLVFGYLRPEERTSADDWKRLADQLNRAGEKTRIAGMQLTYHNHNFEWGPIEGTTGFDILTERMDGEMTPWELDVFWAAIAGQDPMEVMKRANGRLELLHLKQLHPGTPVVTRLADVPPNSFEELPDGDLPIKDYMHYGKELGVKHCMIEQDGNYDTGSLDSAGKSITYLRGNRF